MFFGSALSWTLDFLIYIFYLYLYVYLKLIQDGSYQKIVITKSPNQSCNLPCRYPADEAPFLFTLQDRNVHAPPK